MSKDKHRVAVVGGAGTWGRYYLRTYANHPDCEIVALVDRARDRRQAFADRYGVAQVFDTVDQLLAREVPDIVSAVVPVAQNSPTVIACAQAGVRVVSCEKPFSAELAEADEMLRICSEAGALLACGQASLSTPHGPAVNEWVRAGNIGPLTAAAIPGGLPRELTGGGCVQLAAIRHLTGMEVEWVEGWVLPPEPGYAAPEATRETEVDSPAYGRLGMTGGIVCEIPRPRPDQRIACFVAAEGENGRVWLSSPLPVLIQGTGPAATPVYPDFLADPPPWDAFGATINRLVRALETGEEPESSGRDFRQALEIGIALKLSAHEGHRRVTLPLEDRSLKLYPHPYRLHGGDVAGWKSIGYTGPPDVQ